MKTFLMPIVAHCVAGFYVHRGLPAQFSVETGIRQKCGSNHRHALDAHVFRRRGAPFDV